MGTYPSSQDAMVLDIDTVDLIDLAEADTTTAIVCVADQWFESVVRILRELNYRVLKTADPWLAVTKLSHRGCGLIFLDEATCLADSSEGGVPALLKELTMDLRREALVCLLSGSRPSLEPLEAFRCGVDVIVNCGDLDNMKRILPRSTRDHRGAYAVFMDELRKKGQV
jgi:hypothetical protein